MHALFWLANGMFLKDNSIAVMVVECEATGMQRMGWTTTATCSIIPKAPIVGRWKTFDGS